jgi:hypothetical protein
MFAPGGKYAARTAHHKIQGGTMSGLRMSAMNVSPLSCSKSSLVAFAPGHVDVPRTSVMIEHPKHGIVLWDTGINDRHIT